MEEKIARWLVRYRHWLLLGSVVVVALLALGGRKLYFESDYRIFFLPDDPQLVANENLQNEYTRSDNVVFIVAPKDGRVFTRSTLASIEKLTDESWKLPYSVRVDSITNYQHSYAEGDDLRTMSLVKDAQSLTDEQLRERERIALTEPAIVNALLSQRGHVTAVNVRLNLPEAHKGADTATPEVNAAARKLMQQVVAENPGLDIYINGLVAVNQAFNDLAQRDAVTLMPIMFVMVIGLLILFLRSVSAAFVTVGVILTSIVGTMGFMGWAGLHLNQINVTGPTLIMTLAISDSVHFLLIYLRGLGEGKDRLEAMTHSLEVNLWPVFLTSSTTAIGFLGLQASDSPPFRELGLMAAFGVMAAWVLSLCIIPAVAVKMPVRIRAGMGEEAHWKIIDRLAEFAIARRKPIFWTAVAIVAVFASFIPRNDLNDSTIDYFDRTTDIRKAADFTQENLTGFDSISYSLPAGGEQGVADPAYLRKVEEFARWYAAQPEVTHVRSFTDVMKRLNQNMHGNDPAWYRVPDNRELAAQYLLLYELSLPLGLDLNTQVNFDKSATEMSVSIKGQKAQQLIDIEARAQDWLKKHAPEIQAPGASISLMFAHIGQNNIRSMMSGTFWSMLLISLMMIFSVRSLKFGLISLVPNMLPALMTFGIWGAFSGQVNLAVAVVYSVSIGIIVDDTVHFFTKYLRARRKLGLSPEDSLRYSYATVGSALFVTTAVLTLGFLVLTLSHFTVNVIVGGMTAMTIAIGLAFDMLFLPSLLLRLDRER